MRTRSSAAWTAFDYLYRDAGNYKTTGMLLLRGRDPRAEPLIRGALEWGDQFVAEQVGIPTLCARHFADVGEGPTDLDHAFHEFVGLRTPAVEELGFVPWGPLDWLVARFARCSGRWDVRLSANCDR